MIAAFNPLRPLENLLEDLLQWFHDTAGLSWSWSIVALVVLVRIVLVPVTVRQIHSMQNLQAHAPEMKEIQQRWKHDRARQNEELMKFYRENKINPAASCLPIIAQIPIFISLFFVLKDFEREIFPKYLGSDLDWLGLVDITQPTKDGWGPLLLLVYVASQLSSSWLMSAQMQKAQRVDRVLGAGRVVLAAPTPQRAQEQLVGPHEADRDVLHHAAAFASTSPTRSCSQP